MSYNSRLAKLKSKHLSKDKQSEVEFERKLEQRLQLEFEEDQITEQQLQEILKRNQEKNSDFTD
jgi:hypothetical protein